jgi:AcrR family transcriptional regulator
MGTKKKKVFNCMNTLFAETPPMPHVDLRRQRGSRTKERLITAALKLFGAHGFKVVTTRAIAREATANQASILYHFGGKRQLYLTVADRIASDARAALQPVLEKSRARARGAETTRSSLIEIVRAFARHLCSYSDHRAAASFVARELANPDFGHATIYEGFVRDVHVEVTSLLAGATARFPRDQGAIIDAHVLLGAALGFASASETLKLRSFRPINSEIRIELITDRMAHLTLGMMARTSVLRPTRLLPASPYPWPRKSRTARASINDWPRIPRRPRGAPFAAPP